MYKRKELRKRWEAAPIQLRIYQRRVELNGCVIGISGIWDIKLLVWKLDKWKDTKLILPSGHAFNVTDEDSILGRVWGWLKWKYSAEREAYELDYSAGIPDTIPSVPDYMKSMFEFLFSIEKVMPRNWIERIVDWLVRRIVDYVRLEDINTGFGRFCWRFPVFGVRHLCYFEMRRRRLWKPEVN